jgi:hypothetical protein
VNRSLAVATETPDNGKPEGAQGMDRGSETQINSVGHREVIRSSTQSTCGYAGSSEQQVGALGCGEGLRAGRATVGVGRTVGGK